MTGTWKLDRGRSEFAFLAPPRTRVDVVVHTNDARTGDAISIRTTQKDTNGTTIVERSFQIGGDAVDVEIRGRIRRVSGRWDGGELVISTESEVSGNARRIEDRWRLSEDGKTIFISRLHEQPGGAVRQVLAMAKQAR